MSRNFDCNHKNIAAAGTAEQLASDIELPIGAVVVVKAKIGNTGAGYVADTQDKAQDTDIAFPLAAGEAVTLTVENLNQIWCDVTTNGDGFNWIVEVN